MKKIIITLCVVALVVLIAVPVFADDVFLISGKYEFSDVLDVGTDPNTYFTYNVDFKANFDGVVYDYDNILLETFELSTGGIGLRIVYRNFSTSGFEHLVYTSWQTDTGIGWRGNSNILDFGEGAYVTGVFYNLLNSYSVPVCDGSICPATDVNFDNVCDDCGKSLMMSLRTITLDSLKASTPYYHYLQYKTVDSNTGEYIATRLSFLSSNSPMTVTKAEFDRLNDSAWGGVNFRFTGESDIDGVNYISHDGGQTWEQETTFSNGTSLFGVDENIIASTFNLYDSETGDLFFPLPLWVEMEQVTQGELPNLMQTTGGTITTLTLCGVGLLALLMVLVLFGKRSQIFHL